MNNHVEIKTNDTSGEITINGISVSDIVRKYTITHEAGKPPVIEVELVGDVTVSGGFITPLPEPWKSIYHNLSKGGNDVILMEGKMKDKWVIILYILGSAVGILLTRLILG